MTYGSLSLERKDGIVVLTLNRPDRRNAMTPELTREFPAAMEEVRADPAVAVLIVTGSGSAFCAGGDLDMLERMLDQSPEQNRREMGAFYRSYLSILHVDVPTIAAINGYAIGAGLSFALGCDIRIAAEGAKMGVTYLSLGLHPGMGTTHLLPQIVGSAHAADLMLTCRLVTAAEAAGMGLVSRVAPGERLLDEARAIAREIAARPVSGVRMAKRALVQAKLNGLEAALDYEATAQMSSYASAEMREALTRLKRRNG